MALLQKNLAQLEVESVEIMANTPASERNGKLEILLSNSVRQCKCCFCKCKKKK